MFKRLMILGLAGVAFVLGANYLLIYTLNQQATRDGRARAAGPGLLERL